MITDKQTAKKTTVDKCAFQYMTKSMQTLTTVGMVSLTLTGCSYLQFRGDDNLDKASKLVSLTESVDVLQPVLDVNIGGGRLAKKDPLKLEPAIDGDSVYSASRTGEVNAMKLDAVKLWETDVKDEITGGVAYDSTTQTVVISTHEGKIVALSGQTGHIKWRQQLASSVLSPAAISPIYRRVMVSANNGVFYGLDLQTGQPVWQFATSVPKISVRGSAKPKLLNEDTVLCPAMDGRVYALSVDTGSPLWSHRVGEATGASPIERMTDLNTPEIDNGHLYATSYSGQLVEIDVDKHKSTYFDKVASLHQPVVTNTLVVVSDLDGNVIAYDRKTGERRWKNQQLQFRKLTNPVEIRGYIAIGDLDGVVHLLDEKEGKIISRVNTKGALNHLKVVGNKLITQSSSGHIAIWQW